MCKVLALVSILSRWQPRELYQNRIVSLGPLQFWLGNDVNILKGITISILGCCPHSEFIRSAILPQQEILITLRRSPPRKSHIHLKRMPPVGVVYRKKSGGLELEPSTRQGKGGQG